MEATKISLEGKMAFRTQARAREIQEALQRAGFKHVGSKPDRINEKAVGLYWANGLYYTTDRVEVFVKYPCKQYKELEYKPDVELLTTLSIEGHRTQKAMREGLIEEIRPLVVAAMQDALERFPNMGIKRKAHAPDRYAGWHRFIKGLKERRDTYTLAHVRVVLREEFPDVTQLYDSTFSRYYREVQ